MKRKPRLQTILLCYLYFACPVFAGDIQGSNQPVTQVPQTFNNSYPSLPSVPPQAPDRYSAVNLQPNISPTTGTNSQSNEISVPQQARDKHDTINLQPNIPPANGASPQGGRACDMLRQSNAVAPTDRNTGSQGMTYYLQGKPVSKEQYQAAVLGNEGVTLLRANKNAEAEIKLRQALASYNGLPEVHHSLGLVLAKLGNMQEAIEHMKTAIQLNPSMEASWLTLGGFYQSNGNVDEAIATYQEFLKRFPKHPMKSKVEGLLIALKTEQKIRNEHLVSDSAQAATNSGGISSNSSDDYLSLMRANGSLHRWPAQHMPISVCITKGDKVPGFRDNLPQILRQSFLDWSQASSGLITFRFVDSPKGASLVCLWTDNPDNLKNKAEAGEARIAVDRLGICRGEIWFLTQLLNKTFPLTDNYFRLICLHEIGHALGLSGHTTDPKDVMFYSMLFKDEWRQLSERDARSVTHLYQSY